jgi:hypothetical protein
MKKVSKLVLSAAVVGVFAGCGGDGDGVDLGAPSIVACYAVPQTVEFAIASFNMPPGRSVSNRSTVGPMKYNNQTVTGQTFFYPSGSSTTTHTNYWNITNEGVMLIASVNDLGAETYTFSLPKNMNPGEKQTGTSLAKNGSYTFSITFIGFERVDLAGKTFPNTCHLKEENSRGGVLEAWYAPGYGLIKEVVSPGSMTTQYNSDL